MPSDWKYAGPGRNKGRPMPHEGDRPTAEERLESIDNELCRRYSDQDWGALVRSDALSLFKDALRAAEQAAREEALEEACRAVCPSCERGDDSYIASGGVIRHSNAPCIAWPIQSRSAARRERKKETSV